MRVADPALVAVRAGRRGAIVLLALLGFQGPVQAEEPAIAFTDWANTLYVGTAVLREAGADLSDAEIQGLFTPAVQAMRDAVQDRTLPPGEPAGPVLHILFGWGALPNNRIEIVSVQADDANKATVTLTINGNARRLVLTGLYNVPGKAWQIDDIDYGEGGPDRTLRDRLERMKTWPKRETN